MRRTNGFTLIEMMLVMVVVGLLLMMSIRFLQQQALSTRIDRTSTQMQQIVNAGMAYYVANGFWPAKLADLQGPYLPSQNLMSPWGHDYLVGSQSIKTGNPPTASTPPLFYAWTTIAAGEQTASIAATIAGNLPMAYTTSAISNTTTPPPNTPLCTPDATQCSIVAIVNIPGQNLNNATAVNFAGVYHNGACVPVPQCPVDANGNTMAPEIIVVPVSVSGVYNPPQTSNSGMAYPIISYTAFATKIGSIGTSPAAKQVPQCYDPSNISQGGGCVLDYVSDTSVPNGDYWRVCLSVTTQEGLVNPSPSAGSINYNQGMMEGTMLAFTRCSIINENHGSNFNVWLPYNQL